MGGGEDGNLGHVVGNIDDAGLAFESRVLLEVRPDFVGDDGDVRSESLGGQGDLHELEGSTLAACWIMTTRVLNKFQKYLLLLHKLGVGAVVDNIAAKDGRSEVGVDFLSVDILELAVEDKVVSGGANSDSGLLSEEDKGKNISILLWKSVCQPCFFFSILVFCLERSWAANLFAVHLKEGRGIHAISNGAANQREPGEDHGRLIGILEEKLIGDMDKDGQTDKASQHNGNLRGQTKSCKLLGDGMRRQLLEETHCSMIRVGSPVEVNNRVGVVEKEGGRFDSSGTRCAREEEAVGCVG